jgi:hypothetical protein
MHEADDPDFVGDLFDPDILLGKNLARVDLTPRSVSPSIPEFLYRSKILWPV